LLIHCSKLCTVEFEIAKPKESWQTCNEYCDPTQRDARGK
jgi:hypothetical protein